MAESYIDDISIKGIATVVPKDIVTFKDDAIKLGIGEGQAKRIRASVGLDKRHVVREGITALDLGEKASTQLLNGLKDVKKNIGFILFITQTPDYSQPCNAALLHGRLGFDHNVGSMDINLGCSGYIYGLYTAALMVKNLKKDVLMVVGDTLSTKVHPMDRSAGILFGDAASATLVTSKKGERIFFDLNSDGKGYESIIVPAGGARNPISQKTSEEYEDEEGNIRSMNDLKMSGGDVFNFAVRTEPEAVRKLLEYSKKSVSDIDYFIFHQANKYIIRTIARRLEISDKKVPNSIISTYGNQSSASIPCTINETLAAGDSKICLLSGFGVGLSWASMICKLELEYCPNSIIWGK